MKSAQLRSHNGGLPPVEADLALRMRLLFERCPALHGFTVQDCRAPHEELQSLQSLERELVMVDLSIFPLFGAAQVEAIYNDIAETLLDFLAERPEARELVCGRTIVRVLH